MSAGKATVTFASDQNVAELQPGKRYFDTTLKESAVTSPSITQMFPNGAIEHA